MNAENTDKLLEKLGHVLYAYKRITFISPSLACKEGTTDRLYKTISLCLSNCFKNEKYTQGKEFQLVLDKILSYYQYLILGLYGEIENVHKAVAGLYYTTKNNIITLFFTSYTFWRSYVYLLYLKKKLICLFSVIQKKKIKR